ncbi:MAG: ABC transporter permease [Enterocloster sp.]
MNYMFSLGKEIVRKRKLIWDLGKADFKKRFVGSYFGIVWMFIQPIVTVAIYAFIFGEAGFKSPPPVPGATYVVWLVPGIVPWFFYSEALNSITNCLQEYNYLVKKVVFQVEILPMIKLISCLMVHGFFILIMLGLYLISGRMPMVTWIQILYYTFAASMLALGIGFFTSAVNVFFKDMAQIVSICLQFGIWMTPIMYHESMFTNRGAWIGTLFKLNPFYYVVAGYRDSMLTGNWFWERPTLTVYYWAVTLIILMIGLKMFKRLRPHFSDVL